MGKRMITTEVLEEDIKIEGSLRPQTLDDYIGQEKTKENLKVYIEAAKQRGDVLDHVLFYGPPGLGKTTLAGIIANEMGTHMKVTSGPAIEKPGEMAAILNNLQEGDVLFVDEIHRLNRQVEEVLYPAMEDYAIDIMIGKGSSARSIRLDLPRFTLVGATTRAGDRSAPGPFRGDPSSGVLYGRRTGCDHPAFRAGAGCGSGSGGGQGDGKTFERHSSSCQPDPETCAGFRTGKIRRTDHPGGCVFRIGSPGGG